MNGAASGDSKLASKPGASAEDPVAALTRLRVDIDRIDLAMHELLMERGRIIDELIAIKARQGGGSAFRPGREAEMMRRLAMRHKGILPLDTAEGIWRIIISTFTFVQAHYNVHVDASGGDAAMRDTARFHFGFTVPYLSHDGPTAVIDAVARSQGDLGVVPVNGDLKAGAWWTRLVGAEAPKIIARLPFIERADHPASLPVFVLSKPLAEAAATDVLIWSASLTRWSDRAAQELADAGCEILGNVGTEVGLSLLVSSPGAVGRDALARLFAAGGAVNARIEPIGSHAARYDAGA